MEKIFGRKDEQKKLLDAFASPRAEFISISGRWRIGKTSLVLKTLENKKNTIFFHVTGKKGLNSSSQIKHVVQELARAFSVSFDSPIRGWDELFFQLDKTIENCTKKKIVLFFDEIPWMVPGKSKFLQILGHCWNHRWGWDSRIKLIVCGSSVRWMSKQIINSTGALYGRVTCRIFMYSFSLYQTKRYLQHGHKQIFTNHQILQIYMVFGGIPHYLNQIKPQISVEQTIDVFAFSRASFLLEEFKSLYGSFFGPKEAYIELARIIAMHPRGIGEEALACKAAEILSGEDLLVCLESLVEAEIILRYQSYKAKRKGTFYKMADEFSLFYFQWVEPIKDRLTNQEMEKGYWEKLQNSTKWHIWANHAFEMICYNHIHLIGDALKLCPTALPYAWRYSPQEITTEQSAQIDLLFDREDDVITVCEMKYDKQPFIVSKSYIEELRRNITTFRKRTTVKRNVCIAFVVANGLKKSLVSEELITGLVTLDDLFKPLWSP